MTIIEKKDLKKIYAQLLEAVDNLPNEAIEHTKKEITRKGYDTTGYQYQFLINCLNEVVGWDGWNFNYTVIKEIEGKWNTNQVFYDITAEVEIEILGNKRKMPGGHKSGTHADALKGAITNGIKKTLGMFGIGKKSYEGILDEDNRPSTQENAQNSTYTVFKQQTGYVPHINGKTAKCKHPSATSKEGKEYCSLLCWLPEEERAKKGLEPLKMNLKFQVDDFNF